MRPFALALLALSSPVLASTTPSTLSNPLVATPSSDFPSCPSPMRAQTTPQEQAADVCLSGSKTVEQGYLLGDDERTQIPVLHLVQPPKNCVTNGFSYPMKQQFGRDGVNGTGLGTHPQRPITEGFWFSGESVAAILAGDHWVRRNALTEAQASDVLVARDGEEVLAVMLITGVVREHDGVFFVEYKPVNQEAQRTRVALDDIDDSVEAWAPPKR